MREEWASHCADPAVHLRILEEGRALFAGSASGGPADPKLDLVLRTIGMAAGPLSTLMHEKRPALRRRAPSDKQLAKAAQGFAADRHCWTTKACSSNCRVLNHLYQCV